MDFRAKKQASSSQPNGYTNVFSFEFKHCTQTYVISLSNRLCQLKCNCVGVNQYKIFFNKVNTQYFWILLANRNFSGKHRLN